MAQRRHLLSDRQALRTFSFLLGAWFLLNGLALFEASTPGSSGTADPDPEEAVQFRPEPAADENGTEQESNGLEHGALRWTEGTPWEPRERTDRPLMAALGLLQAVGGATLGVYGVFRWSPSVAGDWLPGRHANKESEADAQEEE